VLLALDRPDLAENAIKQMQAIDDEATITQLSHACVCLTQGGEKVKEASLIYKDLADRYGHTVAATNGKPATSIRARKSCYLVGNTVICSNCTPVIVLLIVC
jgi:hypothetical protein